MPIVLLTLFHDSSMSLAKLTSLSTQTLTLLLERQRLQTMSQLPPAATTQHIVRNLNQLRTGILAIETKALEDQNNTQSSVLETVDLLRNQFSRMKDMLGTDGDLVEAFVFNIFSVTTPTF